MGINGNYWNPGLNKTWISNGMLFVNTDVKRFLLTRPVGGFCPQRVRGGPGLCEAKGHSRCLEVGSSGSIPERPDRNGERSSWKGHRLPPSSGKHGYHKQYYMYLKRLPSLNARLFGRECMLVWSQPAQGGGWADGHGWWMIGNWKWPNLLWRIPIFPSRKFVKRFRCLRVRIRCNQPID